MNEMEKQSNALPGQNAAILIPMVREAEGPAILLEVRSMNVWQPGEICFPGGHIEAGEGSLDAALREIREELGVPASSVRVLKELEPEQHIANKLVYPILAELTPFDRERLVLQTEEVAEVFTLPVSWLLAHEPAVYELSMPESEELPLKLRQYLKNYQLGPGAGTTWYWEYGSHGIWGFTARLLVRLRHHLLEGQSEEP